jgi:hypothetical protein
MATPSQHFDAARRWQEHYQKEVENIGLTIPPPTLGQSTNDYRREMMRLLKKTFIPATHDLYQVQMRELPAGALAAIEEKLLPACKIEAFNPLTVPRGEIRESCEDQLERPPGSRIYWAGSLYQIYDAPRSSRR